MNILFESDLFPEETAIWKDYGASVHEIFFDDRKLKNFAPVVARGAIQFHNSVGAALRQKGWPDLRWPFNNEWVKYGYRFLNNFDGILNPDVSFGYKEQSHGEVFEVEWTPLSLFYEWDRRFGKGEKLWVRSEAGTKGFTGGLLIKEELEVQVNYCLQNNLIDIPLVIAHPKQIEAEYRLLFVGGKYISGSEYFPDGSPPHGFVTAAARDAGMQWMEKYGHNWGGSLTVDVAVTDEGFKIVEVNNLLTSGWYAADIEKVVQAVVQQARSESE